MAIHIRRTAGTGGLPNVNPLVWSLAIAATVELAILRTFTRTAIHIPGIETMRRPYELLTRGGEFAYFLTLCLLLPAAIALAMTLYRGGHPQRHLAAFGLAVFTIPWPLVDAHVVSSVTMDAMTVAAVVALALALVVSNRAAAGVPIVAFTVAFALSALYTIDMASGSGIGLGGSRMLLNGAEVVAVAFACTTPLIVDRSRDRVAGWAAVITVLVVFGGMLGNGSTSRFLLLWNVGLSGTLPSVFYAAAAGALVYAIVRALRTGAPLVAAGLVLLVAGGLGLHNTYQSALVVVGLMALAAGLWTPRLEPASHRAIGAQTSP